MADDDMDARAMRTAERVIDRLAGEAYDAGMFVRTWHGPKQSRLSVLRWNGGSEPISAGGYVEVEHAGGPLNTLLQVNCYSRTSHDRQTMVDLAARARELLEGTP